MIPPVAFRCLTIKATTGVGAIPISITEQPVAKSAEMVIFFTNSFVGLVSVPIIIVPFFIYVPYASDIFKITSGVNPTFISPRTPATETLSTMIISYFTFIFIKYLPSKISFVFSIFIIYGLYILSMIFLCGKT